MDFSVQRKFAIVVPDQVWQRKPGQRHFVRGPVPPDTLKILDLSEKLDRRGRRLLHTLDDHRDPLTTADARRRQTITSFATVQFMQQRQNETRARRP